MNTPGIPLDRLRDTWSEVGARLEALAAAWESGIGEPLLGVILSESRRADREQRRIILIELIKADLEYRQAPGRRRRTVEDYLVEFPELRDPAIPSELLFEEFHLRKQSGEAVEAREYYRRFPEIASELSRLLGDDPTTVRTKATISPAKLVRLEAIKEGQTLDEFELLKLLGKGSFARVYLAWQKSMHRLVGLKVSTAQGVEPQALAQLDHPNIVHVFDRRVLPDQGLLLLYMTYLPGGTLDDVLKHVRNVPLAQRTGAHMLESVDRRHAEGSQTGTMESARMRPVRKKIAVMAWPHLVCWLGARLAEALDHAHRRGVLHRDIKPANILLTLPTARRSSPTSTSARRRNRSARRSSSAAVSATWPPSTWRRSIRRTSGSPNPSTAGPISTRSPSRCGSCSRESGPSPSIASPPRAGRRSMCCSRIAAAAWRRIAGPPSRRKSLKNWSPRCAGVSIPIRTSVSPGRPTSPWRSTSA